MYCYGIKRYWATVITVALFAALAGCESEKQPAIFYPIDSVVNAQALHLTRLQAGLFKEALFGDETDTATYTPDTATVWMKELDIFTKLNEINKAANKINYSVSDGLLDPASNLTVKAFTSSKELPVVYMKIYYQGTISKPRKIEALYRQRNLLYRSARLLSMHFVQISNTTVLTSYSVKGGQKMLLGDSVAFYISGKVLLD